MIPYIGPEFILALREHYSNQQRRSVFSQSPDNQRSRTGESSLIASCMTRLRAWQVSPANQGSSIVATATRWLGRARPKGVKQTRPVVDSTQAVA